MRVAAPDFFIGFRQFADNPACEGSSCRVGRFNLLFLSGLSKFTEPSEAISGNVVLRIICSSIALYAAYSLNVWLSRTG